MQQPKPLTLRRNFSWTFLGNMVYAASQWGMLVVLAKFGSPVMVGQFTLGVAVTTPVLMLTKLQLRAVQATDAKNQFLFSDYLGLRLFSTGLALLIIIGITLIAGYRWETTLVILVIGLAKAFESISDVIYGLLQQYEQMDRIAISMIIKGPISLIALASGVYLTGSVLGGVIGLAIVWALILVGYDAYSSALILKAISQPGSITPEHSWKGLLYPKGKIKNLTKLAWLALPLGLVMMLISLNTNIPRYLIERYLGERELGIFAALAYLQVAGTMVVSALGQSASPRLAKYYTEGKRAAFCALLLKLVGIGAMLGIVGVLVSLIAGQEILSLIYNPEYGNYANIFVWLMVASGIGYIGTFLGYGITATWQFNSFIIPYLIITVIAVTTSVSLIPVWGLLGAAWTLCAVSLASCAMPLIILFTIGRIS